MAAALINVGDISSSYRYRWIAYYDWLEIIKHAYGRNGDDDEDDDQNIVTSTRVLVVILFHSPTSPRSIMSLEWPFWTRRRKKMVPMTTTLLYYLHELIPMQSQQDSTSETYVVRKVMEGFYFK